MSWKINWLYVHIHIRLHKYVQHYLNFKNTVFTIFETDRQTRQKLKKDIDLLHTHMYKYTHIHDICAYVNICFNRKTKNHFQKKKSISNDTAIHSHNNWERATKQLPTVTAILITIEGHETASNGYCHSHNNWGPQNSFQRLLPFS